MSRVVSRLYTSLAESQFFLFGLLVAGLSWIVWNFFLPVGLTEARDQRIHYALPLIFELSFLLSVVFRRVFVGLSSNISSAPTGLSVPGLALNLLVVIAGCCFTFTEKGSSVLCITIVLGILIHEWLWTRLSRYRLLVLVEFLLAVVLIASCFKAQALVNVKHTHHWSFYLGPLYGVLGGGKLLWSVPSQYGFLVILTPALIAQRFGLSGIEAFGLVVALMHLGATVLLFYFLTSRAKLSPLASAMLTIITCLFLPGWLPDLAGPTAYPSVTGLRFFPALLTVVLAEKASRARHLTWAVFAVIVGSLAFAWSFESFAYALASLGAYAGLRAFFDLNPRFLATSASLIPVLALCGGALIIVLYALAFHSAIDVKGFYEYAIQYADTHNTLPIEFSVMTIFYVFALAFSYFFARSALRFRQSDTLAGTIAFFYLWMVSTYYVARSHPNNVLNLTPWALAVMVASAPRTLSSQLSSLHRVGIVVMCALFANFLMASVGSMHPQNLQQFFVRVRSSDLWVAPRLQEAPKEVMDLVRSRPNVTAMTFDEMVQPHASFVHSGNSSGLSPLWHLLIPGGNRHCEYLGRILKERGELYILMTPAHLPNLTPLVKGCQHLCTVQELPKVADWSLFQVVGR